MKEKDPAFLFYPKDWFLDTSTLSLSEKAIFIDLLCFQHQNGYVPSDTTRLAMIVGLPVQEFLVHWVMLSPKFPEIQEGSFAKQFANQKLSKVVKQRSEHSKIRTITGTFGALLRAADLTQAQSEKIRKQFKTSDFENCPEESLKDLLSKWLAKCLPNAIAHGKQTLEDGDANGIGIGNEDSNILLLLEKSDFLGYEEIKQQTLDLAKIYVDRFSERLDKLEKPLQPIELCKLIKKYGQMKVMETFIAMDDWKPLLQKSVSVYSTAYKWIQRDIEKKNA